MIDVLTLKKQTPLHLAAATGQLEVCKLLLELGANIDATDDKGQKPIHVAAQNNFPDVAQLFLQRQHSLVMATTKVRLRRVLPLKMCVFVVGRIWNHRTSQMLLVYLRIPSVLEMYVSYEVYVSLKLVFSVFC